MFVGSWWISGFAEMGLDVVLIFFKIDNFEGGKKKYVNEKIKS